MNDLIVNVVMQTIEVRNYYTLLLLSFVEAMKESTQASLHTGHLGLLMNDFQRDIDAYKDGSSIS